MSELKDQHTLTATEPRPATLVGHEHIRFYLRPLLLPFAVVVALLLSAGAWPRSWEVEGIIAAFCVGVIATVTVFVSLPLVAVRDEFHRAVLRSRRGKPRRTERRRT